MVAVGVKRIVKIAVRVAVIVPRRRCRHAYLKCRLEIFQDLAPIAFAAETFVDGDEIKEILGVVAVQAWPPFVLRDGLINCEVHLAAFDGFPYGSESGSS